MALIKSTAWFAFGTMISRVSGLIRDMVVVSVFGASSVLDAFIVAFRIPNLFREMLAEGALANAFTKVYSELNSINPHTAESFFIKSFQLICLIGAGVAGLGMLLAPYLVDLMTLYSDPSETFIVNATGLTRILFPFLSIMMVGSVVTGALYEKGRFFLSAVAPVGFNVFYIVGATVFGTFCARACPSWVEEGLGDPRVVGLALGVVLGGLTQVSMNAYALWKPLIRKALRWPNLSGLITPEIRKTFYIMLPAAIAASTGPINQVVNTNFATSLPTGSVTWLNYAFRLLQLPIGVFGVAIGVAILPRLSKQIAQNHMQVGKDASRSLQQGCEYVLWIILPCWVFLFANSQKVIEVLFGYGRFSATDVTQTGEALKAYSMGLVAYALIKVLISFYYAVERTSYALRVALLCIGVNLVGNFILVKQFAHVGLALTTAVTLSVNALALLLGLRRHRIHWQREKILWSGAGVLAASAFAVLIQVFVIQPMLGSMTPVGSQKLNAAIHLIVSGVFVTAVFSGFAYMNFKVLAPRFAGK